MGCLGEIGKCSYNRRYMDAWQESNLKLSACLLFVIAILAGLDLW